MAFVNDDQIGLRYLATSQGLDGANLYRLTVIRKLVLALNHSYVEDSVLPETINRLINQGQGRYAKQNPPVFLTRHVDDGGSDDRLTGSRRGLNDRPSGTL
jgi:hypothetical protein